MNLLEVNDLSVKYATSRGDIMALSEASFVLSEDESLGIAGESACGKSTLGLAIIRMLFGGEITSGDVIYKGESILNISESDFTNKYRWKQIAMVFQGAMNSLDPVFKIKDQFKEVLKQHGYSGDHKTLLHDSLKQVGLDSLVLEKYPHELSGGMKQRVVIAMALLLHPRIVIADEPTTALDVLIQAQIINLLKKLKKQKMSIVLISHDLAVLSEVSDKIAIMYAGQIVEFGSSYDVYKNPKHPYTKALLDSVPTLHGNKPKYIPGVPPSLIGPKDQCRFIDRCPMAMEKCKTAPPDYKTESGYVKCWLYEK